MSEHLYRVVYEIVVWARDPKLAKQAAEKYVRYLLEMDDLDHHVVWVEEVEMPKITRAGQS